LAFLSSFWCADENLNFAVGVNNKVEKEETKIETFLYDAMS